MRTISHWIFVVVILFGCVSGVFAHHSRSNFDLVTVIDVEGVVTEFTWRNPHVFATMDVTDEDGKKVEWLIEMQGTPILKRFGWDKDSLKVGDKIVARGNPDKNPQKNFLYLDEIHTETGVLWGDFPATGFTNTSVLTGQGKPRPEALRKILEDVEKAKSIVVSGDFVGRWLGIYGGAMNFHIEDAFFTAEKNARTTPAGFEILRNYNDEDDPALRCEPYSIPYISSLPFATKITREKVDGEDVLKFFYVYGAVERIIHLEKTEHPENIELSHLGYSIGRLEEDGNILIIDTIGFAPATWATARGINQSEQKRVVEKYRLVDGGRRMEYVSFTTDPPYLSHPLVRAFQYGYEPEREIDEYDCDIEASKRHLSIH